MKILKELETRVAGERLRITVWENGSVMLEFGDGTLQFENTAEVGSFIATLQDLLEQEEIDEDLL